MSTPDTKNDSSKHLWNPLLNFATLPTAGYYLGSEAIGKLRDYSVFQWIPSASLTPTEFAVGGAINAAALSGIEYISGRDGAEIDFTRMALITLTLAAMVFAAPHATKATSQWTGVVLTTDQMLSVVAFNGLAKLTTLAFVSFMKYMQDSSIAPIPTSNEEARNLSQHQAAYHYDCFNEDSTEWDKLPLSIRVIMNMRFKENGSDQQLPLKGFKDKVGEKMEAEELKFLQESTKGSTDFSVTERKHLNSLFYEAGLVEGVVVSKDTMPKQVGEHLTKYEATDFATLQESTVRWICFYLREFPNPVDEARATALSDRMVELKIASPNHSLVPSKKPTAPKDIAHPTEDEKYLLGWFIGYFKQNAAEFDGLSIDERIAWNDAFTKELNKRIPLSLSADEASKLTEKQAIHFHILCNNHGSDSHSYWATRPLEVQKALNNKFDALRLSTRALYPQSKADALGMSNEELQTLHDELQANAALTTNLCKEASDELTVRFNKMGLWMPFSPKPDPTFGEKLAEKITVTNTLYLVGGIALCVGIYCLAPTAIAAIGAMFKGSTPGTDDCTVKLEDGNHTAALGDVVCFESDSGQQKLKVADTHDYPNGVLATGTKVSVTADRTLCIGEKCETVLTPIVGGSSPFNVTVTPILTDEFPELLTRDSSLTLDARGINVLHDGKNTTISDGMTVGGYTFETGNVVSLDEDGRVCVATTDGPCGNPFIFEGETLAQYTAPTKTTIPLTSGSPVTLEDNVLVQVTHDGKEFSLSIGQVHGEHTFAKGDVVSINADGHICVGNADELCAKTFTTDGETLTPYTAPTVTTIPLTKDSSVTLDDNVLVQVTHDGKEFSLSIGQVHGEHTFAKGDVVSINAKGHICVGNADELCAKTFTTDGETLTPYTAPLKEDAKAPSPSPTVKEDRDNKGNADTES
ncbi:hypothetical protein [Simkania sp.]|uniref:hypothetical protein n=1 Tax=Simkania sp. TaxID=34094 RepID=UPI003B520F13